MKVCRDCGQEKPLDEFSRDSWGAQGRASHCKPCKANRSREWRRTHPEQYSATERGRRAYKRAHEDAARAACPKCGQPMEAGSGYGNGRTRQPKQCRDCFVAAESARVAERTRELETLWANGATYPELRAHFGWSASQLSVEMVRARRRGANLPYRYTTGKRAGRLAA